MAWGDNDAFFVGARLLLAVGERPMQSGEGGKRPDGLPTHLAGGEGQVVANEGREMASQGMAAVANRSRQKGLRFRGDKESWIEGGNQQRFAVFHRQDRLSKRPGPTMGIGERRAVKCWVESARLQIWCVR